MSDDANPGVPRRRPDITFAIELDPVELTCRIGEAITGRKRPPGLNAEEALSLYPDDLRNVMEDAAITALEYLRDQVQHTQRLL